MDVSFEQIRHCYGFGVAGSIEVSGFVLAEVFGQPDSTYTDGKTTFNWYLHVYDECGNKHEATIYDYYSKDKTFANCNWHIGGRQKIVVDIIHKLIENHLKENS